MLTFSRRGAAALAAAAFAAAMFVATPAFAQTAEARQLGQDLSTVMYGAIDFKAAMAKETQSMISSMEGFDMRPEWPGLLSEAMAEELDHDLPAIKRMTGEAMARRFTVEELKAGLIILSDPGVQQIMAAAGAGKPMPSPEPQMSRAAERTAATPAGRAFMKKFAAMDEVMKDIEGDLAGELVPGVFRRFADKAEAAEAARAAAP